MKTITRRSFLKTGATAAAATLAAPAILPRGWYAFAQAEAAGYFEREFGISDALCRRVLARALTKGGDFADLFFEHTISNFLILEDGKVNRAACDVALGVGIRTVKGDQVGYGFTQDLSEKAMLAAASTAATIADASGKETAREFVALKTKNYYPVKTLFSSVPLDTKLPLVQSVNDKCFARSPLVTKVNVTFHDQQKRILVVTSDGVKAEDLLPRSYLAATAVAEKNGKRERASWNFGGRREFSYFAPELVERLAKKSVDGAVTLFDAIQPPAGEMPVVLGPGVTGVLLHEAIGHGMEADFNRK
jgi:TldD protein